MSNQIRIEMRNLPFHYKYHEVRGLVLKFGHVNRVFAVNNSNGEFSGTAQITFAHEADGLKAIEELSQLVVEGRQLQVKQISLNDAAEPKVQPGQFVYQEKAPSPGKERPILRDRSKVNNGLPELNYYKNLMGLFRYEIDDMLDARPPAKKVYIDKYGIPLDS